MSGLIKTHEENLSLTNNWLMDCQHGKVKGWTARSEYGANPSVGTSLEDLWSGGATVKLNIPCTIRGLNNGIHYSRFNISN